MRVARLIRLPVTMINNIGRRRATSISKIRNTTASRKKRRENGIRAEFLGSNPHSKGVSVLRWEGARMDTESITVARAAVMTTAIKIRSVNFTIMLLVVL